jgi:hypothetical protein
MLRSQKLLSLLVLSVCLGRGKDRDWQTGKVLNSQLDRTYIRTAVGTTVIRDTRLWIVGEAYAYLVIRPSDAHRCSAITKMVAARKRGCQLVVGDDIKYAQEKAKLHVLDTAGKGCKLQIVRGEQLER